MSDEENYVTMAEGVAASKRSTIKQMDRLSSTSNKFDCGDKGFLSESEKIARAFANDQTGEIPTTTTIKLVGKQRDMNNKVKTLTVINILNLVALVSLAVALGILVSLGNNNTQETITSSIHTKVASDPAKGIGAILTDVDGNAISTIAGGSSVTATLFVDKNSGNTTVCISMNDLTQMVLNNENGIRNIMSVKDNETGDIMSIINLEGDAEIEEDQVTLASGKYQFVFDSPACNSMTTDTRGRRRLYNRRLFNENLRLQRSGGVSRSLLPGLNDNSQAGVQGFKNH